MDEIVNRHAFAPLILPSFAEGHGCKPVDECEAGTLRSLGEGGYASEGSARRSMWRGATAVRPWGSTTKLYTKLRNQSSRVPAIVERTCTHRIQSVDEVLDLLPTRSLVNTNR